MVPKAKERSTSDLQFGLLVKSQIKKKKTHLGIKAVEACMHARKYGAMVLDPTWLPDADN